MITFMVFIFSDENNVLTPQITFVSLTLFGIMQMPMSLLPMLIVYVVEVLNTLRKLTTRAVNTFIFFRIYETLR